MSCDLKSIKLLIITMLLSFVFVGLVCNASENQFFQKTSNNDDSLPVQLEAVDLGLPSGTLWANMNLGSNKPEEIGCFFAWGETKEKESDEGEWANYIHCDGTETSCHDIGSNISGTNYDAAHVHWGGKWQMPTIEQIAELIWICEYKLITFKGKKGYLFTSEINGNSIFIPLSHDAGGVIGLFGSYWSSNLFESDPHRAGILFLDEYQDVDTKSSSRCFALSIRPVCNE